MRNLSDAMKEALFAQQTNEAYMMLVTIDHDSLAVPIRITTDPYEDIGDDVLGVISRSQEFVALPFELTWPNEDEDQSPVSRVRIDNISREIVAAVRNINSPADFTVEIVTATDPNTVEASLVGFQLRNVRYDAFVVEGDLTIEIFDQEPFPSGRFDPARFPGLF
jgi:hypothetical protein